jgi:hypothetical protein
MVFVPGLPFEFSKLDSKLNLIIVKMLKLVNGFLVIVAIESY